MLKPHCASRMRIVAFRMRFEVKWCWCRARALLGGVWRHTGHFAFFVRIPVCQLPRMCHVRYGGRLTSRARQIRCVYTSARPRKGQGCFGHPGRSHPKDFRSPVPRRRPVDSGGGMVGGLRGVFHPTEGCVFPPGVFSLPIR